MKSVRERLESWRWYEHAPGWLGDAARVVIPQLEAEIAASADTHPKGGDVEQAPSLMSGAVPEGQTPKGSIPSPGSSDDV